MMRSAFFYLGFIVLVFACNLRPEEKLIVTPQISSAFYQNSVDEIEQALKQDPDQPKLIKLQLEYYKNLGWPEDAKQAVRRARQFLPLGPVIARDYADFYNDNELYFDFIRLREELIKSYAVPPWMGKYSIVAYNAMGSTIRARELLEEFFLRKNDPESHFWGGKQYLIAGDTSSAIAHLNEAYDSYKQDSAFISVYIPVASHAGLSQKVLELLETIEPDELSESSLLEASKAYFSLGNSAMAKAFLWTKPERSILFQLSEYYQQEYKWDSAHYALDRILQMNEFDKEAILEKGELEEKRGWLSRSLSYYQSLWDIDSTYSDISERIQILNRKIAYLRKIREQREDIPTLDLERKNQDL